MVANPDTNLMYLACELLRTSWWSSATMRQVDLKKCLNKWSLPMLMDKLALRLCYLKINSDCMRPAEGDGIISVYNVDGNSLAKVQEVSACWDMAQVL